MARGRMISKSLSTSAKRARLHDVLGPLAEFAQGLFPLLVVHADDFGRESGDAFTVRAVVDPTSPRTLADFETALGALAAVGLIERYRVGDRELLSIVEFDEHQTGLHKRTEARAFPPPPGTSGNFPEVPASRARAEEKRNEEKRTR